MEVKNTEVHGTRCDVDVGNSPISELIKRIYSERPTDVKICNVDFHSYVLKLYSNAYSAHENILETIETNELVVKEFKELLYGMKKTAENLSAENILELFLLFDYLLIEDFIHVFNNADCTLLMLHLIKCNQRTVLYYIIGNCKKIDHYTNDYLPILGFTSQPFERKAIMEFVSSVRNSTDTNLFHVYYEIVSDLKLTDEYTNVYNKLVKDLEKGENPITIYNIARMQLHGRGTQQDRKKAVQQFLVCWEKYHMSDALNSYACCLAHGIECEVDKNAAAKLFLQTWEEFNCLSGLYNYICLLSNFPKVNNSTVDDLNKYAALYRKITGKQWP